MLETFLACLKIFLSFFLIILCFTFFAAKNSNIFPGKVDDPLLPRGHQEPLYLQPLDHPQPSGT